MIQLLSASRAVSSNLINVAQHDLALHEYKIRSRVQFQEDISWRVHRPYE